jgi:hypothetical protein
MQFVKSWVVLQCTSAHAQAAQLAFQEQQLPSGLQRLERSLMHGNSGFSAKRFDNSFGLIGPPPER